MKILSFNPKSVCSTPGLDDSRLGDHAISLKVTSLSEAKHGIVILGFADDTGIQKVGGRLGAKEGPAAARMKLYKLTTGRPALPVYDLGDLQPAPSIEETHRIAADLVKSVITAGHFPIVLGGGHDLGFPHVLGVLESFPKTPFVVCNIDAHLDVRPTSMGITSGSPWYLLAEHPLFQKNKGKIEEFGIQPHCNAHTLVKYAKQKKFGLHWLEEIRRKQAPADRSFQNLLKSVGPTKKAVVSLDIDGVQWSEAPGCSAPQVLGFSASEAISMSRLAGAHPRVESFGIFELSPPLDTDGRTAQLVAQCIIACMEGVSQRTKGKKK